MFFLGSFCGGSFLWERAPVDLLLVKERSGGTLSGDVPSKTGDVSGGTHAENPPGGSLVENGR